MLLILPVIVGIGLGYLRGGKLSGLASLSIRYPWLVVVSLLIQIMIFPLFGERAIFPYATHYLHFLSYALAFSFIIANYRIIPLLVTGTGAAMNLVVITVNSGYMPSSVHALSSAGMRSVATKLVAQGTVGNVCLMGENTNLNILGDLLFFPEQVPMAAAFSIGDLVLAIGIGWLLVRGMTAKSA